MEQYSGFFLEAILTDRFKPANLWCMIFKTNSYMLWKFVLIKSVLYRFKAIDQMISAFDKRVSK